MAAQLDASNLDKSSSSSPPSSSRNFFSKDPKRKLSRKGKEVSPSTPQTDSSAAANASSHPSSTENPIPAGPNSAADVPAGDGVVETDPGGRSVGQDPVQPNTASTVASSNTRSYGKSAELSAPPVAAEPSNASDNKERDKGSLSTTVTGTASQSKHRKTKTGSEGAHSSSTENPIKAKTPPKPKKPSFFTILLRSFLPCVGPPKSVHPDILDEGASHLSDPSSSADALKEKQALEKDKETLFRKEGNEAGGNSQLSEPSTSTGPAVPLTIAPDLVPIPTDDPAVVVPPSPNKHVLPPSETAGLTSGAVQPPGSTGGEARDTGDDSDGTSFTEDEDMDKELESAEDEEERLIMNGGIGIPIGPDGVPRPLLPPIAPQHAGRKCLVLDMDETLLHSSFKSIQHADYVIPVEIEYHWHNVYVIKRPGVDNFLKKMGEIYEVVVFTASLSKYADPVLDKLDIHQVVSHRLFRESCYNHKGNYVKDLSQLGRPMADTIILDNSPASYIFHPNNAVPVSSWFNDPHDTELTDLCPFLADLRTVDDVRGVLDGGL